MICTFEGLTEAIDRWIAEFPAQAAKVLDPPEMAELDAFLSGHGQEPAFSRIEELIAKVAQAEAIS